MEQPCLLVAVPLRHHGPAETPIPAQAQSPRTAATCPTNQTLQVRRVTSGVAQHLLGLPSSTSTRFTGHRPPNLGTARVGLAQRRTIPACGRLPCAPSASRSNRSIAWPAASAAQLPGIRVAAAGSCRPARSLPQANSDQLNARDGRAPLSAAQPRSATPTHRRYVARPDTLQRTPLPSLRSARSTATASARTNSRLRFAARSAVSVSHTSIRSTPTGTPARPGGAS
jgi:hypothetical protein